MVCTCINGYHGNDLPNAYCLGIVFHVRIVYIYSYVSYSKICIVYITQLSLLFYSRVTESREVALFHKRLGAGTKEFKGREFRFQIAFFSLNSFFVGSVIAHLLLYKWSRNSVGTVYPFSV